MKNYFQLLIILASSVVFSCQMNQPKSAKPIISTSILPQKYFIERLTGDRFDINVMVPPGASPATYAPSSGQIKSLSKSIAYLKIGHIGFEQAWEDKMRSVNPGMAWFDLSKGIELIEGEPVQHGDHHHAGGADPHIWTSPSTVKLLIINLQEALVTLAPEFKEDIIKNADAFLSEVSLLDDRFKDIAREHPHLTFMIYHPAYTYLARDYGFEQITIEHQGKTPSLGRLKGTIQQAKEHHLKAIFVQQEFDKTNAEVIAKEIGAKIIEVNPLNENWHTEMEHLLELMKQL